MRVVRLGTARRGARLSNTCLTYPREGDNPGKLGPIPHRRRVLESPFSERDCGRSAAVRLRMGARPIMVVGGVMARQAEDGWGP